MHPLLGTFVRLTLIVAAVILVVMLAAIVLKVVVIAAILAAVAVGCIFLYNVIRGRGNNPLMRR
jgi:hypothetical protein